MDKTIHSLMLARVLGVDDDGKFTWVGGDTVVVQLGDVLDRGNTEIGELGYRWCSRCVWGDCRGLRTDPHAGSVLVWRCMASCVSWRLHALAAHVVLPHLATTVVL